ncbi:MAG: hypothetical protein QMD46_05425 [Methanomicrobiales archaeon]|nr:hypothetical protein [Methanomicrobiales archaeon]
MHLPTPRQVRLLYTVQTGSLLHDLASGDDRQCGEGLKPSPGDDAK